MLTGHSIPVCWAYLTRRKIFTGREFSGLDIHATSLFKTKWYRILYTARTRPGVNCAEKSIVFHKKQ